MWTLISHSLRSRRSYIQQSPALAKFTGYGEEDLKGCAIQLCRHVRETITTLSGHRLDACKRKYSAGQFLAVSKVSFASNWVSIELVRINH